MSNPVINFELPADDLARARDFYSQTFHWQMTEFPGAEYCTATTSPSDANGTPRQVGAINGGIAQSGESGGTPMIVIGVPDIADALSRIRAHGGTVLSEPKPVGGLGFSAHFRDTEGNLVGLWQHGDQS